VMTDSSLRRDWNMGAALVAKDCSLPAHSVAVFGQLALLRQELTGIALALEDSPGEEDLNILTDSLSSMRLLKSPLSLHRHPVLQMLLHVVKQLSRSMGTGHITLFIKVHARRGEQLNELTDLLAAEAA
jgi:hypothetical protein